MKLKDEVKSIDTWADGLTAKEVAAALSQWLRTQNNYSDLMSQILSHLAVVSVERYPFINEKEAVEMWTELTESAFKLYFGGDNAIH